MIKTVKVLATVLALSVGAAYAAPAFADMMKKDDKMMMMKKHHKHHRHHKHMMMMKKM